jgi:SAM-dependent methyltransferase
MAVVEALCDLPRGGTMLELGCGNAFHSYLLASRFEQVIATDLALPDPATHTIGLARARTLQQVLGVSNLRLVAASAEHLPLVSGSVDFVFSSNVLEHVPDQARAVAEIFRVLRPGGRCLTIVPAAMERVYNFPVSYFAILHGMLRGLRRYAGGAAPAPANGHGRSEAPGVERSRGLGGRARGFLGRHYPTFPFPKPHGEYPSSAAEFMAHRPSRWRRLFIRGGFEIERTFATILAPHNLGMAVSFGAA